MDGQNNFDSGWEWGYWLQDVVTARGIWNPYVRASGVRRPLPSASRSPSLAAIAPQLYGRARRH